MAVIGFSPAEVTALLEVTAVVLKLGNVELSSCYQASGMEACSIAEPRGRAWGGTGWDGTGWDRMGPPPLSPSPAQSCTRSAS